MIEKQIPNYSERMLMVLLGRMRGAEESGQLATSYSGMKSLQQACLPGGRSSLAGWRRINFPARRIQLGCRNTTATASDKKRQTVTISVSKSEEGDTFL